MMVTRNSQQVRFQVDAHGSLIQQTAFKSQAGAPYALRDFLIGEGAAAMHVQAGTLGLARQAVRVWAELRGASAPSAPGEVTVANGWYEVTQNNADTGETYTATGHTVFEALAQVVSNGQAATRHHSEDAAWLEVLAEALSTTGGEVSRGFARYTLATGGPVRVEVDVMGPGMCDECGQSAPTVWNAWLGGPDQDFTSLCAECAAIHLPGVALPPLMETVAVECACRHCKAYAARIGLAFPLRAEVNTRMHAAICTTPEGVHAMVQKAYQPPFGRMDAMQAKMGPWPLAEVTR